MKLQKSILAALLTLIITGCSNGGGSSNGKGDEGPMGGDQVVQQAQLIISNVVMKIENMPEVFPEVNIRALQDTGRKVKLIGRDKTFANGVETDAINDGQSTIYLNLTRWNKRKNYDRKLALIFHEMLGILGIEKNNYAISSRLLVENRFAPQREYQCGSCSVLMWYDANQKGFVVQNKTCTNFARSNTLVFKGTNGNYTTYNSCFFDEDEVQDGQPVMCSSPDIPRNEWNQIQFDNGYAFHFLGFQNQQLNCALAQ